MEALNALDCDDNTIFITEPSTIAFQCMYEIEDSVTTYTWTMDGSPLPGDNSNKNKVYASITAGTHYVTCKANIDVSHLVGDIPGAENCTCSETRHFYVIVVGTYP